LRRFQPSYYYYFLGSSSNKKTDDNKKQEKEQQLWQICVCGVGEVISRIGKLRRN